MFQNNLLCILKNVACTCLLTFWGEEQKVQVLLQRNPAVAFLHLKKCFLLFYLYAVESFRTVPLNVLGLFFFFNSFLRLLLFFFFLIFGNLHEFLKYPH